jgi:hypothetical protein
LPDLHKGQIEDVNIRALGSKSAEALGDSGQSVEQG